MLILEGAIEMGQRLPCVLPGQFEIPERGISGIERGHHLQRERQLALRASQIAGLKEDPCPVLSDRRRRVRQRRRHDRLQELGELRRRDGRQRRQLRRARAQNGQRCEEDE